MPPDAVPLGKRRSGRDEEKVREDYRRHHSFRLSFKIFFSSSGFQFAPRRKPLPQRLVDQPVFAASLGGRGSQGEYANTGCLTSLCVLTRGRDPDEAVKTSLSSSFCSHRKK